MAFIRGAKTIGLATLIASGSMAFAEDGVISWSGDSTWAADETPYSISLGGFIGVQANYFDLDEDFNEDTVLRNWASAGSVPTLAAAAGTWAGVNSSFADGVGMSDIDIWLKGTFYGNTHAMIKLDAGGGTATVDDWYIGLSGIPFVGTALLTGEADIAWGLGDGVFYDDTIAYDSGTEDPDLFGLEFFNEFMDGKIGYTAAIGMAGGSNTAAFDRNYDLQFELFGVPYETDDMSLMVMGSFYFHNPSSTGHNPLSTTWGLGPSMSGGGSLGGITVLADEVMAFKASASFVYGPMMVGASVGIYETSAPSYDGLGVALAGSGLSTFLSGGTIGYTDFEDGSFMDWKITAAYSLTGETQGHGGGITPNANFAWDGSGYGAFEVVARLSGLDAMDDTANGASFTASPTVASVLASLSAPQLEEGVEVFEAGIGINWYLNPAFSMGAYLTMASWEYDDDAVALGSAAGTSASLVTGQGLPPAFDFASIAAYSYVAGIKNDYDVLGFYYYTSVSF